MTLNNSILFNISQPLQAEIDALSTEPDHLYESMDQLTKTTNNGIHHATAKDLLSQLAKKSRLLDLGCGFGETSLLLAAAGHEVHSIEPAPNRCKALAHSSSQLNLNVSVYTCTSEELDKTSLKNLDGALFYSSLHHCDNPLQALIKTKTALGPQGVIIVSEPVLKFYRSKKWFYRQLDENPIQMGHYGGNEHIYSFKEYYDMLTKAGFKRIDYYWAQRNVNPRNTLVSDLSSIFHGHYQHTVLRSMIKFAVHTLIRKLTNNKFLNKVMIRPLLRLSLLQAAFVAHVS